VFAGLPHKLVDDVKERGASESEETPLVPAANKRTNKTGNDHDLIDKDGEENSRPRHASSEHEIEEEQRSRNEPINVADIEDGSVVSAHLRVVGSVELDSDGCETEVGSHGEVGDASDKHDRGGDVVEDAVTTLLAQAEANEADSSN
jgi:hypothetical protein